MTAPDSFKATCKRSTSFGSADLFWDAVTGRGGEVLEPYWLGSKTPHRIRCAQGHEGKPRPDSTRVQGICNRCGTENGEQYRTRRAVGEVRFRAEVKQRGGTVLGLYKSNKTPVLVCCHEGHTWTPYPVSVVRGSWCGQCAGLDHRTYYIVASEWMVKPGITSDDPRPRLSEHRRSYRLADVHRVVTGLPEGLARSVERRVLEALAEQGVDPCFGNEYFRAEWLDLVIHEADEHLANELWALPAAHQGWKRS